MYIKPSLNISKHLLRPTLEIFLFHLTRPCFSGVGWSVGRNIILFLFSQVLSRLKFVFSCSNIAKT